MTTTDSFTIPEGAEDFAREAFKIVTKSDPIEPVDPEAVAKANHRQNYKRCIQYMRKMDRAVSGSGGHIAFLRASRVCVRFDLDEAEHLRAMEWFSANMSDPPWSEREINHKVKEGRRLFDMERGKLLLKGSTRESSPQRTRKQASGPTTDREFPSDAPDLVVRRASDIEERDIDWLCRPILVAGGINMAIGMPDVGKGIWSCDVAARISTGSPWPPIGGVRQPNKAGTVVMLSMEDSPETTIVGRLRAAGASLDKVLIVEGIHRLDERGNKIRDAFDIGRDIQKLESLRQKYQDMRLVIIDPLDSYISAKVDTNIGNKARAALLPLKNWTEATGVAALIIHHFNKSTTTNALDKVSGARSFGALPRSVWALGREENGDRTILAPVKMNLIKQSEKRAQAFTIESSPLNPDIPIIAWIDEEIDVTAAELLGAARGSEKREEAKAFLLDLLADGPMDAKEVMNHGLQAGHSLKTLNRAKDDLHVCVIQRRSENSRKIAGWTWTLSRAHAGEK